MAADCAQQETKDQVVSELVKQLNEHYIHVDKAKAFAEQAAQYRQSEAYSALNDCEVLAEQLNQKMSEVTQDGHLFIAYSEDEIPVSTPESEAAFKQHERAFMRSLNYGIDKVERFSFNIGYINMLMFADAEVAAPTIAAAMNLVAHTEALIIDLRYSRGGDPATVDLIASYLLDQKTNTSNIYYRDEDRLEQRWTSDSISGARYGQERPLYILTSEDTYSAAEDFSYTLKHLNRATLIGETTGGGAHPGDFVRISEHFEAFIPNGKSINPVTETNWEGVGVIPHIAVPADKALNVAQVHILKKLLADEKDPRKASRMEQRIASLEQ